MTSTYFCGANSAQGFYSLYDEFPPKGIRHILKGCPGSGKSGFMRAVGTQAERRGLCVEYVLCSGDPDSLDGVYIPALGEAWVDGTAPHVLEPGPFGIDGDYVNLGRFCRGDFSEASREAIGDITRRYKALYAEGYGYLAAAARIVPERKYSLSPLEKRLEVILRHSVTEDKPTQRRVFLRAISCKGVISLADTLHGYDEYYVFTSSCGGDAPALKLVWRVAERRGLSMIVAMSPLEPDKIEALLLPGAKIAFFGSAYRIGAARHIRLDSMLTERPDAESAARLKTSARIYDRLLALALDTLRRAKALHDELEAQYRPYMDFAALTEFTEKELRRIFD